MIALIVAEAVQATEKVAEPVLSKTDIHDFKYLLFAIAIATVLRG